MSISTEEKKRYFQKTAIALRREDFRGKPVYPPARRKLAEHGIDCSGKTARQLRNNDYEEFDLLIGMDQANLRSMYRIWGGDFAGKMHLLMDFTDRLGGSSRSVVHRRFRGHLAVCGGGLPGAA